MNAYYETFIRKDIFKDKEAYAEIVIEVCEKFSSEQSYVYRVIDDYVNGASRYHTYKRLKYNIIDRYEYLNKKQKYLDDEFKEKMSQ